MYSKSFFRQFDLLISSSFSLVSPLSDPLHWRPQRATSSLSPRQRTSPVSGMEREREERERREEREKEREERASSSQQQHQQRAHTHSNKAADVPTTVSTATRKQPLITIHTPAPTVATTALISLSASPGLAVCLFSAEV